MNDFLQELQELLKTYDEKSLRQIGEQCDVSYVTIWNVKQGRATNLTVSTYNKIKQGLGGKDA